MCSGQEKYILLVFGRNRIPATCRVEVHRVLRTLRAGDVAVGREGIIPCVPIKVLFNFLIV